MACLRCFRHRGGPTPAFCVGCLRQAAVEADMTTVHEIREMAFGRWQRHQGALVNASVPLWIAACGMKQ